MVDSRLPFGERCLVYLTRNRFCWTVSVEGTDEPIMHLSEAVDWLSARRDALAVAHAQQCGLLLQSGEEASYFGAADVESLPLTQPGQDA
jgi:hypothetical protein